MKLVIKAKSKMYDLEVDDDSILVKDLKKQIEALFDEKDKIPAEMQCACSCRQKLEDNKALKDYNLPDGSIVYVFKADLKTPAKTEKSASNPYAAALNPTPQQQSYGRQQMPPMNHYQMPPNAMSPSHMQYQMPPYGAPWPPQGPYQMPQANLSQNNMIQQMESLVNNPAALDPIIDMYFGNLSPEQKQQTKEMMKESMKIVKNDPSLLQQNLSQMQYFNPESFNRWNGGGMPQYQHPYPSYGYYPPPNYPPQSPPFYGHNIMHHLSSPHQRSPIPLKDTFSHQLAMLNDMGFCDEEANLDALSKAEGDIGLAIDFLHGNKP